MLQTGTSLLFPFRCVGFVFYVVYFFSLVVSFTKYTGHKAFCCTLYLVVSHQPQGLHFLKISKLAAFWWVGFGVSQLLLTLIKPLRDIRILVREGEDKRQLLCRECMRVNINEIILIEIVVKVCNGWNWSLKPCLQQVWFPGVEVCDFVCKYAHWKLLIFETEYHWW